MDSLVMELARMLASRQLPVEQGNALFIRRSCVGAMVERRSAFLPVMEEVAEGRWGIAS
jgi:hypothetical protein